MNKTKTYNKSAGDRTDVKIPTGSNAKPTGRNMTVGEAKSAASSIDMSNKVSAGQGIKKTHS